MILKASCGVLSVLVVRIGSSDRMVDFAEFLPLDKPSHLFLHSSPQSSLHGDAIEAS